MLYNVNVKVCSFLASKINLKAQMYMYMEHQGKSLNNNYLE